MSPTTPAPDARRSVHPAAAPKVSRDVREAIVAREGDLLERPMRPLVDVSALPTVTFGSRSLVWWGTIGFMVVEGVTLAICVGTYFYLRRNFENWPPLRSPRPSLLMPTVGLLVLLAGLVPTYFYKRAAERLERRATHLWLWGSTLALVAATVIRVFEFFALGVRWDLNAYASATWAIVFAHFTLLLASAGETATIAFMFLVGADEMKHFPDASDNAMYYNFLVLAWIPLWAIVYLLPRWV